MIINPFVFAVAGGGEDAVVWDSGYMAASYTLSNGDRTATVTDDVGGVVRATHPRNGQKVYAEFLVVDQTSGAYPSVGIGTVDLSTTGGLGNNSFGWGYFCGLGWRWHGASNAGTIGTTTPGNRAMIAVDMAAGKYWHGVNGTWTGDPGAGTGATWTDVPTSSDLWLAASMTHDAVTLCAESSQQSYSPPSGFVAWAAA